MTIYQKIKTCAFLAGVIIFASQASASVGLSLTIDEATSTSFGFTITGDFGAYTAPASNQNLLYLVPVDSLGNIVSGWLASGSSQATSDPRPAGKIDTTNSVIGWGIYQAGFWFPTADAYLIMFGSNISTASSITEAITFNQDSLNLDMTNIAGFDLYWGETEMLTSSAVTASVPEPATYGLLFGALILGLMAWSRRQK